MRELLRFIDRDGDLRDAKREEKITELSRSIREVKIVLYGNSDSEPTAEGCAQVTQEFFKENTLRLLIVCLPKLSLEARNDVTQIVANLQRQQVQSRLIASDYLEANKDLLDILISGYEDVNMALHYGLMLRECIRHQSIARYILEFDKMKKFFGYIEIPNFDISSDAYLTFKELMTRHKSTVAEYLSKNYEWFFSEYNTRLLSSSNYIIRRQSVKLLGDMLLDQSNSTIMVRYVSSKDNLMILMNLLRESSQNIQIEAFRVFKLFVVNQKKPPEIRTILITNQNKLLRLLQQIKLDKASLPAFFRAPSIDHSRSFASSFAMVSLADSQCDRAQRYHQIQGRSMRTVRSYLPPPPPALPSSAAVSENLTDSLVDFKRRKLAAVGVGPSLSANSSAEHQELLEISRGFSDCSSFGSDISGELQRLAYFAISKVPRSVAASNVGSLEESWLSTSSESLEYASVEGVEPVVRACVEHLRLVSVEAKREAAARIRLLAKHRSDFRSLIGTSGSGRSRA